MKTKIPPPVLLLDIMLNGRFFCQLRYTGRGRLEWLGEKLGYVYNEASIRSFIERMRPSLRGKDYKVDFAKQRVI